jgi:hypothetical protein
VSSNIAQNYPAGLEREAQRSAAVAGALERFEGLRDKVAAEASPLGEAGPDEEWWIWVCPREDFAGRLHVAGYALERRAVYTVCDSCGEAFLR